MTLSTALAILLMQVGPNPTVGQIPGVPEELRNREPRAEQSAAENSRLTRCLQTAARTPEDALDEAQMWRESADDAGDLAQSAHCLGLALVRLGRLDEARRIFETARDEAPVDNPAYRARLAAMAGNAAMAQRDAEAALPLFAGAAEIAATAGDPALLAGLETDRARALVALGRNDEAAAALTTAREADPANVQAWLLSATLSRRMERLGEAQRQIEQAALLAPRNPAIGLEAGVIAALAGRGEDARRSFESVIEVAPDSEEAARARTYLEQVAQ